MALLSIFRIRNISNSISAWKISQKIRTFTIIPRERENQQIGILLVSCTIPFSGCIQIISQALSFFSPRHSLASPLTFTLSDLKRDTTLKYWSSCSPRHGLRVVQVITEMQNGKRMLVIKQNLSTTLCRSFCRSKTVFKVSFNITSVPEHSRECLLSKRGWEALLHILVLACLSRSASAPLISFLVATTPSTKGVQALNTAFCKAIGNNLTLGKQVMCTRSHSRQCILDMPTYPIFRLFVRPDEGLPSPPCCHTHLAHPISGFQFLTV